MLPVTVRTRLRVTHSLLVCIGVESEKLAALEAAKRVEADKQALLDELRVGYLCGFISFFAALSPSWSELLDSFAVHKLTL